MAGVLVLTKPTWETVGKRDRALISGLSLRAGAALGTQKELQGHARSHSDEDQAHARGQFGENHRRSQSEASGVGLTISSKLIRTPLSGWIALYGDGCGRCFESTRSDRAWEFVEKIISAGPINSSRPRDCSLRLQPVSWRANPDEETTDWRAVCGRTARTVRRAGTAKAVSDPYQLILF